MSRTDDLIPWLRQIDEKRSYTNYGSLNNELERRSFHWSSSRLPKNAGYQEVLPASASCAVTAS